MGLIKKLIIAFVIISILASISIVKNNDLNVDNPKDAVFLIKEYGKWTGNTIKNIGSLTAQVIRLDWLPRS